MTLAESLGWRFGRWPRGG